MEKRGVDLRPKAENQASIEPNTMLGPILIAVLMLMIFGVVPFWPHSRKWGYYPGGVLALLLVILVILVLLGKI